MKIVVGPVAHPLYATDGRCEKLGEMRWAWWYTHSIPLMGDERNWDRCRGTGGDSYLHSIPLMGDVRGTGDNLGPVTFFWPWELGTL